MDELAAWDAPNAIQNIVELIYDLPTPERVKLLQNVGFGHHFGRISIEDTLLGSDPDEDSDFTFIGAVCRHTDPHDWKYYYQVYIGEVQVLTLPVHYLHFWIHQNELRLLSRKLNVLHMLDEIKKKKKKL
jgi:hypothetical protein